MSTSVCLAGFGWGVALLAPGWLARIAASGHAPRLGVAAWLATVATVVGAWVAAAAALVRSQHPWLPLLGWCLVTVAVVRVAWFGAVTYQDVRAHGAAHGRMVAILGRRDPRLGVMVVEAAEPVIYCLRGPAPMVVVTTGAHRLLTKAQLSAALAHERAHLAGRHHLLLACAMVARRSVPWLRLFTQAEPALSGLLEMRADDVAAGTHGRRTVAAAIAAMSARPTRAGTLPAGALGAVGPSALARGIRLCGMAPVWRVRLAQFGLALTILVLAASPYLTTVLPFCADSWW